jgi:hypothetical protein
MRPEEKIHFALCDYIRLQYPKVHFISESSGIRTSMGLAAKLKRTRSSHTHLDIYILEPNFNKTKNILILEMKAKTVYKKDGTLKKDEHLQDQQNTINTFNKKPGYEATFACSLDEGIEIVNFYLTGQMKIK